MDDSSNNTPTQDATVAVPPVSLVDSLPNRYELLAVLGSGGAGVVYKALDTSLNKLVAIKKLHNSASQSQSVRFHREAKILAALRHPSVMGAMDFGVTEKNEPYLVLDYVVGETLAAWLKKNGAMAQANALAMFIELTDGLAHAHRKGIIHRDIKPSNIMLVENEKTKTLTPQLVDFGLAKETDEKQDFTKPGVGIGTPKYMSPEQVLGEQVGTPTDIYSFGCLMFEVLTGTSVFSADTPIQMMNMHLKEEPQTIAQRVQSKGINLVDDVSPGLEAIVSKCLSKRVEDRFKSAEELNAALLNEFDQLTKDELRKTATIFVPDDKKSQKNLKAILIGATAVVLLAVSYFWIAFDESTRTEQGKVRFEFISPVIRDSIDAKKRNRTTPARSSVGSALSTQDSTVINITEDGSAVVDIRHAKDLPRLTLKERGKAQITPDLLMPLAEKDATTELTLCSNNIGPLFSTISRINSLRTLKLIASKPGRPLPPLEKPEELKVHTLILDGYALSETAFSDIGKIEKMSMLALINCTELNKDGLSHILRLNPLSLFLEDTDFGDSSIAGLKGARISQLVLIKPRKNLTNVGIQQLAMLPQLNLLEIKEPPADYTAGSIALSAKRPVLSVIPSNPFAEAEKAKNNGEYEKALECCNQAININPNVKELYALRALVEFQLKDLTGARKDLDKGLSFGPDANLFKLRGELFDADRKSVARIQPTKGPRGGSPSSRMLR